MLGGLANMSTTKTCYLQIPLNAINACQIPKFNDLSTSKFMSMDNLRANTSANVRCLCHVTLVEKLKSEDVQVAEKVKNMRERMRNIEENSLEELVIVDTIKRLGIDHLFQEEISQILHTHYCMEYFSQLSGKHGWSNHDLYEVSLRFRLLRQEGYVSTHTFDGFLGQDMKFNEQLGKDIHGLLSLFEASQVRMHGENILDEAEVFSKRNLSKSIDKLDYFKAKLVRKALKHPLQKTLARFTAIDFLSTLSNETGWRNELQELAHMDFKAAQIIYQNEILHISEWWKNLGLDKEFKFARGQPHKWHLWSLAMLSHPSLSNERIQITKAITFIYIIDDIFDVHGTPKQLSFFTEAVRRWEFYTLDMLPDYMKICLKALFDVTNEISHMIWSKYGFNPKDYIQKAWTDLINAYLVEHKWFATGYLPTTKEYLKVATITSGVHVALAHMYFLLGGRGYEFRDYTKITSSTAMILRVWDDLGGFEEEDPNGHDGSYIKCYINEEEDVCIEDAHEHVRDLVSDAWKSLNQELVQLSPYSSSSMKVFTKGCLNLARVVPLMYDYDKNHKLADLDKFVTSLLYQSY